ncbi:sugar transferase [Gordonia sp. NPDC003422]
MTVESGLNVAERVGPRRPASAGARVFKRRQQAWLLAYAHGLWVTDTVVVIAVVFIGQTVRFGGDLFSQVGRLGIPAIIASVLMCVAWVMALRVMQATDTRVIGNGPTEYSRVLRACFGVFGLIAIVDLLFNLSIARGYLAIVLPLGTASLLISRWLWRKRISLGRERGEYLRRVLVVGAVPSARPLITRLAKNPELGYEVVGLCVPVLHAHDPKQISIGGRDIPIVSDISDARDAVARSKATAVAVTSSDVLGHSAMRELSWDLEGMDVEMLVAPGLLDVAGPRITMRPQAGLPLLHIEKPRYLGATRLLKLAFDKTVSLAVLFLLFPVLVATAIAIKLDSSGPVFYRGERIGLHNKPFAMWKFRSMVQDADSLRGALAEQSDGNGVLFKLRDDPRVTRVGRFIRRYSLDELPQLFNVVGGSMSLVGPRPPLQEEVETYDSMVVRRMLVRPGITGLWQVSGRSDLSWEESVQLDLSYVENWSLPGDLIILWRTVRAVLAKDGAY